MVFIIAAFLFLTPEVILTLASKNTAMSEITRILTNLTMAYGLMSKDQFVDAITNYAHSRDMNEDKVKELIEQVFDELELTNKRRKANQAFEAVEKERAARMHFSDFTSEPHSPPPPPQSSGNQNDANAAILEELSALRKAVQGLTDTLARPNNDDNEEN